MVKEKIYSTKSMYMRNEIMQQTTKELIKSTKTNRTLKNDNPPCLRWVYYIK